MAGAVAVVRAQSHGTVDFLPMGTTREIDLSPIVDKELVRRITRTWHSGTLRSGHWVTHLLADIAWNGPRNANAERIYQASRVIIRHAPRTDQPTSQARMTHTATVVDSGNSPGFPPPPPGPPPPTEYRYPARREMGGSQPNHGALKVH